MSREIVNNIFVIAKNYIINGAMDYWQRGTSFTTGTNGQYGPDRMRVESSGNGVVVNHTQSTDIPSGVDVSYSILSTSTSSLDGLNNIHVGQKIEASILGGLLGKTATFSCWVKSSESENISIRIHSPISGVKDSWTGARLLDETLVINQLFPVQASTWTKITYTFLVSESSFSNGIAISVNKDTVDVGDTLQTTGWQFEKGNVATNFERAGGNIINELQLCQRYFEKSWSLGSPPGTNTFTNMVVVIAYGTAAAMPTSLFNVYKRTIPDVTIYGRTGTINKIGTFSGTTDIAGTVTASDGSQRRINTITSDTASMTIQSAYRVHFTADAEL